FVETGCFGGAPSGVQYRRCQIGQDLSAARFVLYAKSILHPAGVRLPLTSPSTNMSPAGVKEFFTSSAVVGILSRRSQIGSHSASFLPFAALAMTKLIIQIPCYNEEATLALTLAPLPRQLPGIDCIEWLVIDDGSRDSTIEVARQCGVDHIIRLPHNQGLARAFIAGLEASLEAGADIIVNTDADNQYSADDLPKLVEPILSGKAEIVIGARPIDQIEHFSPLKKMLQRLGSSVVRLASNTDVIDAPSGFRAMTRDAAMRMNVFNNYTYTLETIIQAGQSGLRIASVPIRTNGYLRPSRLVTG